MSNTFPITYKATVSTTHPREILSTRILQLEILDEIYKLADDDDMKTPLDVSVVRMDGNDDTDGWGGKGRVAILGDIAHAVRPASGLGGAMTFEDVVVFCRLIQDADLSTRSSAQLMVVNFDKFVGKSKEDLGESMGDRREEFYERKADFVDS